MTVLHAVDTDWKQSWMCLDESRTDLDVRFGLHRGKDAAMRQRRALSGQEYLFCMRSTFRVGID
jgi:hypothetical protein